MNIEPIAHIVSPFHTKFGIPRQAGLAPSVLSTIVFEEKYANPDALRKIDEFDRLWLIWGFSENICDSNEWHALVRPPRLGGNEKAGVFATRSPFRPNNLGLSCVELVSVEDRNFKTDKTLKGYTKHKVLVVSGADLVNGTPIYDIKPYMSYSDSFPDSACGFVNNKKDKILDILCSKEIEEELGNDAKALFECLARDPRPAYHEHTEQNREYGFDFGAWCVKFSVDDEKNTLCINSISKLQVNA